MQPQTDTDLFNWQHIHDDRGFWDYHRDNPDIYAFFKAAAFRKIERGYKRLSSKGLIELARDSWEVKWNERLKINNNYTAGYSRLFMKDHPQYDGIFEVRGLKAKTNKGV